MSCQFPVTCGPWLLLDRFIVVPILPAPDVSSWLFAIAWRIANFFCSSFNMRHPGGTVARGLNELPVIRADAHDVAPFSWRRAAPGHVPLNRLQYVLVVAHPGQVERQTG